MSARDNTANGRQASSKSTKFHARARRSTKPHNSDQSELKCSNKKSSKKSNHRASQKMNNDAESELTESLLNDQECEELVETAALHNPSSERTTSDEQETVLDSELTNTNLRYEQLMTAECSRKQSASSSSSSSRRSSSAHVTSRSDSTELRSALTQCETPTTSRLPDGWEVRHDINGLYYLHVASGQKQRSKPNNSATLKTDACLKDSLIFYHDDDEINQITLTNRSSIDEDEFYDTGAALTVADDLTITSNECTFVVYPVGCCEFDETATVAATGTKAIQKCILQLSHQQLTEDNYCWGLDQSRAILMKLFDDHIQFIDLKSQNLLRSQPIQTIRSWAVDDDNNFAFVVEDQCRTDTSGSHNARSYDDSIEAALMKEPSYVCYVVKSVDDDDMSCKVASKINHEMNRIRDMMAARITRSTIVQQMADPEQQVNSHDNDKTDAEDDFDDELEASSELTMIVKYIGSTQVSRPTGIDVLNAAIDKCLDNATIESSTKQETGLMEVKLHISPSSVIVEQTKTGEIIVECRIRYLTFMGISRRDIRWCGFIMQNPINKTFVAHCLECYPSAGYVCEAIQSSCAKMYERMVKNSNTRHQSDIINIIPGSSGIRDRLAKTFSRIKLRPINL